MTNAVENVFVVLDNKLSALNQSDLRDALNIISAFRGPDNEVEGKYKASHTAVIRATMLPKTMRRRNLIDRFSKSGHLINFKIPIKKVKSIRGGTHFTAHLELARKAILK